MDFISGSSPILRSIILANNSTIKSTKKNFINLDAFDFFFVEDILNLSNLNIDKLNNEIFKLKSYILDNNQINDKFKSKILIYNAFINFTIKELRNENFLIQFFQNFIALIDKKNNIYYQLSYY